MDPYITDFTRPVVYAFECEPCPLCGEPVCPRCGEHYADCPCPGPHSEPDESPRDVLQEIWESRPDAENT